MWRCTRTEEVHCLRIGCSAPTYKNKRGTGPPNHSPPHPSMHSWALLMAGRARRPRHHLHPGPLRHLPHPYMRRAANPRHCRSHHRHEGRRRHRGGSHSDQHKPLTGPDPTSSSRSSSSGPSPRRGRKAPTWCGGVARAPTTDNRIQARFETLTPIASSVRFC